MKEKLFLVLFAFCLIVVIHFLHFHQLTGSIQTDKIQENRNI